MLCQLSYSRDSGDCRSAEPAATNYLLGSGPAPMAIGASDHALCDLELDCSPVPATDQACDLHVLCGWIDMIELEDGDIGCTAVDARMSEQVIAETP
jgi:hypothetical protein